MADAEIGLIGLGTMGSNLALNIAEKGYRIAVYNRTAARTDEFVAEAGPLAKMIVPCHSLEELAAAIKPPRPIILMVVAGPVVDEQIKMLREVLSTNDIIIDAGNADFNDTRRRFAELEGSSLTFIGMGVSGGEEGARHGPSIMVGGTEPSWKRVKKVLTAISAKHDGEPCAAWLGNDGAGHFVKTIHNGIEYADMQMIAEIYGVLRDGVGMKPKDIGKVFDTWNKGRLNSYLIEITGKVLAATDKKSKKSVVDIILDRAGQKGTGKWSAIEAQKLSVPATGIEAAVAARVISSMKSEREAAAKIYGKPKKAKFDGSHEALLKDLELALFAGKIAAYAQGFAAMDAASGQFGWKLPLPTIAKIWREGCIIRSQFLGQIADSFSADKVANLMMAPAFVKMMKQAHPSLRRVVALSAENGLPVPALAAALAYFDGYRQARGTADLIQGQRDFFGAHGFERVDGKGSFHGPWGSHRS